MTISIIMTIILAVFLYIFIGLVCYNFFYEEILKSVKIEYNRYYTEETIKSEASFRCFGISIIWPITLVVVIFSTAAESLAEKIKSLISRF